MARSERSLFENEYVVQLLAAMKEQTLLCNEILKEKRASKPSVKETSVPDGSLKFTQKEIKSMPSLKDCKIRFHKGVYEIRYRKHGYNKTFYDKTLAGAKDKARSFMTTINNKIKKNHTPVVTTKKGSLNAAKYCENWLKNVKARKIKPISFKALYSRFANHLQPILKKYSLEKLSASVIQQIFDSVSTKNGEEIRTILNGMFEYAIANNLIDHSPMPVVIVKKHERENGSRLMEEQEKKLLKLIEGSVYETTVKLYLYTGARPSELKTIKFDWDNGTFTLQNSKLKSYQKNHERTIPIFPTLYAMKNQIMTIDTNKINTAGKYNNLSAVNQFVLPRYFFRLFLLKFHIKVSVYLCRGVGAYRVSGPVIDKFR